MFRDKHLILNRAFAHERQQATPDSVFHGRLAQWRGIQHYINRVFHFDRHVIAGGRGTADLLSTDEP